MTELSVPRKQVLMCAFSGGGALRLKTADGIYRIDPHDTLERMLNGHDTYELTTATVTFTGSIDIEDAQIMSRLSARPK